MLVYGRQEYQQTLHAVVGHLRHTAATTRKDSVDEMRTLLIQAGQLEQAVADWHEENWAQPALHQQARQLTDCAAAAFHACWAKGQRRGFNGASDADTRLAEVIRLSELLRCGDDVLLTIRIPEGFEYYALFPEQYCVSARRWAQQHTTGCAKRIAVVGIRSIGTTLSAVVAATLESMGWRALRRTVRPKGNPFARVVSLEKRELGTVRHGIVVDEGPGLSGSSMAAAAAALVEAGISDISFFPGHAGQPGSQASAPVRDWWTRTPRYMTPIEELSWNGLSLPGLLAAQAEQLALETKKANTQRHRGGSYEDLSGGLWRRSIFSNESEWPAACARFERMKILCRTAGARGILWKFGGLGCIWKNGSTSLESCLRQMTSLAEERLVPKPLGTFRGFLAVPWIEGTRLSQREGLKPTFLQHLGRYLSRASLPALSAENAAASFSRLSEMLLVNVKETMGEALAERCLRWAQQTRPEEPWCSYGDGRLAPYEWIQTEAGELLKTDGTGHELDHTVVGPQPVLWDVAGALIEWGLDAAMAHPLLKAVRAASVRPRSDPLAFYQMAYAGFRMGLTSFCAEQLSEGDDQARLQRAAKYYRRRLENLLKAPLPTRD